MIKIVRSLQKIEELLKHILAIHLYQSGVSQQAIARHLRIAKAKANELLKGVAKDCKQNEKSKS